MSNVDTDHFGEYKNDQLEIAMSKKTIIGSIVGNYREHAADKAAICYCVNVNHSKTVANSFLATGISAAHVDGNTPKAERNYIVEQFRHGNIKVLCNAELFGEGFDVPHCQAVILARPTKSLTLYIQQAMRPLRPDPDDPNKIAIIFDHVQNFRLHGLPNDNHFWSLLPNPPKKQVSTVKTCPQCDYVVAFGTRICPICRYEFFAHEEQQEVTITECKGNLAPLDTDFELTPIDNNVIHAPNSLEDFLDAVTTQHLTSTTRKSVLAFQALSFARSFEDCLRIAHVLGYKDGWAIFKALELANSYDDCLHIARTAGYKDGWAWHKWNDICSKKNNMLQNARSVC